MRIYVFYIQIIFAFLISFSAGAQLPESGWAELTPSEISGNAKSIGDIYQPDPYTNANHFLQNDWQKGILVLEGGSRHENVYLKYNAFTDQLMVYNEMLKTSYIADKETVYEFKIVEVNQGIQVFRRFNSAGENKQGKYFRVLYEGVYSLLAYHKIIETKTSLHKDVFGVLRDTEFRRTVSYYLFNPATGIRKIVLGKRSLLLIKPEKKEQIRDLLKKNRIGYSGEDEMVRAIKLIESEGILN